MNRVFRVLHRFPVLHRYLRRAYISAAADQPVVREPEITVGETLPIEPVRSVLQGGERPRLNLLVPALSIRHVFGGISTALQVFDALLGDDSDARIILTDETRFSGDDNAAFQDWTICALDDADRPGRIIIPAGDRFGRKLPIRSNDRFMATAWWTARLARDLAGWQTGEYGLGRPQPFVYLIQDYEPGFYPWSARYALAEATYHDPDRFLPVFNTSLLKRYFLAQGHRLDKGLVLEPGLNPQLRDLLTTLPCPARERQILVYGRPGTERNAFPVLVEGLKMWSAAHPGNGYRLLSAGEPHPAIPLAHGQVLESVGKLTLRGYADHLLRSELGISLMVSPHPSYPPLEMAAFGMRVITNRFAEKDLSEWTPAIRSIEPLAPETLSKAIEEQIGHPSKPGTQAPAFSTYLAGGTPPAELAKAIRQELFAEPPMRASHQELTDR